jgi:hypothetical protein
MKKLLFLSLFTLSFFIAFSQTKKTDKTKTPTNPKPSSSSSSSLVQEILWPTTSNNMKNNAAIKPRPVVVTKLKI